MYAANLLYYKMSVTQRELAFAFRQITPYALYPFMFRYMEDWGRKYNETDLCYIRFTYNSQF